MNDDAGSTTGELAAELAFIQRVLELAIEFEQTTGRHPSARDLQRLMHSKPRAVTDA